MAVKLRAETASLFIPMLKAGTAAYVGAALTALVGVLLNDGYGSHELPLFLGWSVPFAIVLALAAPGILPIFVRLSPLIRYPTAVLLGMGATVLWLLCPLILLGPWAGGFSVPVLPSWLAGSVASMLVIAKSAAIDRTVIFGDALLVLTLALLVSYGAEPALLWLTGQQQTTIMFIRWEPGPTPTTMDEEISQRLRAHEVAHLRSLDLGGTLSARRSSLLHGMGRGACPCSRTIMVMQRQVEGAVELSLADNATILYIQTDAEWQKVPAEAATQQRTIRLVPRSDEYEGYTAYFILSPTGEVEDKGAVMRWSREE